MQTVKDKHYNLKGDIVLHNRKDVDNTFGNPVFIDDFKGIQVKLGFEVYTLNELLELYMQTGTFYEEDKYTHKMDTGRVDRVKFAHYVIKLGEKFKANSKTERIDKDGYIVRYLKERAYIINKVKIWETPRTVDTQPYRGDFGKDPNITLELMAGTSENFGKDKAIKLYQYGFIAKNNSMKLGYDDFFLTLEFGKDHEMIMIDSSTNEIITNKDIAKELEMALMLSVNGDSTPIFLKRTKNMLFYYSPYSETVNVVILKAFTDING